jgi:hypothetical protein
MSTATSSTPRSRGIAESYAQNRPPPRSTNTPSSGTSCSASATAASKRRQNGWSLCTQPRRSIASAKLVLSAKLRMACAAKKRRAGALHRPAVVAIGQAT